MFSQSSETIIKELSHFIEDTGANPAGDERGSIGKKREQQENYKKTTREAITK